jgi:hypothetical protein
LGVSEAAYRLAREYAHSREQFGGAIERLAPVAEMVANMSVRIEAMRALTYETARVCDIENNTNRLLERNIDALTETEKKEFKQRSRTLKRLNAMLTPMSKYYGAEGAIAITNDTVQVLGGSGFLRDYAAERYLRDARITSIYEGTSQLQVVAASRGIVSGVYADYVKQFEQKEFADQKLNDLKSILINGRAEIQVAIDYAKSRGGNYVELVARRLVDASISVLIGHYLLAQAEKNERKKSLANLFITRNNTTITMNCNQTTNGNSQVIDQYQLLTEG